MTATTTAHQPVIEYLAGVTRPEALPARRDVVRTFGRHTVRVETRHPEGFMYRGRITRLPAQPGDGALSRYTLTDYDHYQLPQVLGDYADAEDTLLEATAELDA